MDYVLGAICLVLVAAMVYQQHRHDKHNAEKELAWRIERTGLLTRIQHPEIVVGEAQEVVIPDDQLRNAEIVDDIDLVGTIQVNGSTETD